MEEGRKVYWNQDTHIQKSPKVTRELVKSVKISETHSKIKMTYLVFL